MGNLRGGTTIGGKIVTHIGNLRNQISSIGDITVNGIITSYNDIFSSGNISAYSDEKLKDNLEVIPDALNKVKQLSGYTFDRVDMDVPRQAGVIAQEVQKVLPEVVQADKDGTLSVSYGNLVGLLIEAIKEQDEKIEELISRLDK